MILVALLCSTTHGPTPGPLHGLLLPTRWCALHIADVCFFVYLTVSPMGLEALPEQGEIWFVLFMGHPGAYTVPGMH